MRPSNLWYVIPYNSAKQKTFVNWWKKIFMEKTFADWSLVQPKDVTPPKLSRIATKSQVFSLESFLLYIIAKVQIGLWLIKGREETGLKEEEGELEEEGGREWTGERLV